MALHHSIWRGSRHAQPVLFVPSLDAGGFGLRAGRAGAFQRVNAALVEGLAVGLAITSRGEPRGRTVDGPDPDRVSAAGHSSNLVKQQQGVLPGADVPLGRR